MKIQQRGIIHIMKLGVSLFFLKIFMH